MEPPTEPDPRPRGRFYDAASPEAPAVFRFERLDPPDYRVMARFEYVDEAGHWYRVPVDTEQNTTDFASIPFFLTWLVPKDGTHTPAAVLHDALIGGEKDVHYQTSAVETVPDQDADRVFREAMGQSGVPWLRRWMMWAAVALRSLTVKITKDEVSGEETQSKRWLRIAVVGVTIGVWAALSALMALDVPDLLHPRADLPWLGDRSWASEIARALVMVAVGTVGVTVLFGLVLWSQRGFAVGAIAGVAVGFLGLPMIASLVGAAGYFVLEALATVLFGGSPEPADGP